MKWRRRRETNEIYRLVRMNDRIQLQVGGRCYFSRIEDIGADEIRVAAPMEQGEPIGLSRGQRVVVNIIAETGVRSFSGRVTGTIIDRVVLFSLSHFSDWGVMQQRNDGRIQDVLLVRARRVLNAGQTGEWLSGVTQDVGRGGAGVILHEVRELQAGDPVEVEFLLPDERALSVIAQVLRVSPSADAGSDAEVALQFDDIDEERASRIAGYVRKRQWEMESRGASFVRCPEDLPVRFHIIGCDGRGDGELTGSIYDLSATGFRMTVGDPKRIRHGVQIEAAIALGGLGSISVECEVAWIRPGADGRTGYQVGARFTRFCGFAEGELHKYLTAARNGGVFEAA